MITLDSVIRTNKKYYPQTLLEKCKYEIKKNKMENLISLYVLIMSRPRFRVNPHSIVA